jgi:hypothetical protein
LSRRCIIADRFTADATINPIAYRQITDVSAAVSIYGGNGRVALIQALNANVRWRDDGTNPTDATGMRLHAGATTFYVGNLRTIKFIQESAGAELNISVYE